MGILVKAMGKKDLSKLIKKLIVDKRGRKQTVWVRPDEWIKDKNVSGKVKSLVHEAIPKLKSLYSMASHTIHTTNDLLPALNSFIKLDTLISNRIEDSMYSIDEARSNKIEKIRMKIGSIFSKNYKRSLHKLNISPNDKIGKQIVKFVHDKTGSINSLKIDSFAFSKEASQPEKNSEITPNEKDFLKKFDTKYGSYLSEWPDLYKEQVEDLMKLVESGKYKFDSIQGDLDSEQEKYIDQFSKNEDYELPDRRDVSEWVEMKLENKMKKKGWKEFAFQMHDSQESYDSIWYKKK